MNWRISPAAAITERAMRGEIEFEPALRERIALLKGLPVGVVDEVLARFVCKERRAELLRRKSSSPEDSL